MSKATESVLNELHALVAKVLADQLEMHEKVSVLNPDGGEGEIELSTVSPAMIAQAIKFLKDNNITATPETDENLSRLKDSLNKRTRHSDRLSLVKGATAAQEQD